MMRGASLHASFFWGPRHETPRALAQRWMAAVLQLGSIHPSLAAWFKGADGRGEQLTLNTEVIQAEIARNGTGDGYRFNVKSDVSGHGPRLFELDMRAGSDWMNVVVFGTDSRFVPENSIATCRVFNAALRIISESFDVERSYAYPAALQDFWPRPPNPYPPFPIAWISYCAPRIAHLVTPPATALVERRPDGGLLMAATDETFDVDNLAHMSVARDIEAAVAPLNCTRSWEPEDRRLPPM